MTAACPHPLANPFNTQRFTNFSIVDACAGRYAKTGAVYGVPDSQFTYNDVIAMQASLHVPNQNVPLGDQLAGAIGIEQDLVHCSDGTVIRMSDGKILHSLAAADGQWAGSGRVIQQGFQKEWKDTSIDIDQLEKMSDAELNALAYDIQLSPEDKKYWEHADKMAKKLCADMSIDQKIMLAELSGIGFFKTKLVDDDNA